MKEKLIFRPHDRAFWLRGWGGGLKSVNIAWYFAAGTIADFDAAQKPKCQSIPLLFQNEVIRYDLNYPHCVPILYLLPWSMEPEFV